MTKEQLLKICPGAVKADVYAPLLDKYMKEYGITSPIVTGKQIGRAHV